ncbi:MAG: (Fe-S)-binding protein [Bacteroidales bacterium]
MHERYSYDPFVIPYMIGLIFVLGYLIVSVVTVFKNLPIRDKKKMLQCLFSYRIFIVIKDVFLDCILHVKIWKKNKLLGYMHSSIAFGWLMLIIIGHVEIFFYAPHRINLPYYPIFFRYFMMKTETTLGGSVFFFLMDFFLLIVLSGIALALIKRIRRKMFGMKRTTKLKWNDQLAVYALWSIFPLRFFAESFTSGISGGSFLTRSFGMIFDWFSRYLNDATLITPMWWSYSIALMVFFLTLPWSRFTHILGEVLLIYMRDAGIRESNKNNGYAGVEIFSCSRCGMCLDPCQLVSAASLRNMSSIDFTRNTRFKRWKEVLAASGHCLMCNRCVQACPVGVNSVQLKLNTKRRNIRYRYPQRYNYIPLMESSSVDVVYFAGCMSHLTPKIEKAMVHILDASKEKYLFLDENGGVCCGRPIFLAGDERAAEELIAKNKQRIEKTGAHTLVCSCPICYKIFKDLYALNSVEVLHHSQYILRLVQDKKIHIRMGMEKAAFHDPCELGRNSGVYKEPRELLSQLLQLQPTSYDGNQSLCCGHSIAAEALPYKKKRMIAKDAIQKMCGENIHKVITACPSCKKAFEEVQGPEIEDIAEVVNRHLIL